MANDRSSRRACSTPRRRLKYLGMDVHGQATVFCLLNAEGEVVERGSLPTTAPDLTKLIQRLSSIDTLLCGQEVGTMTYFVHDVVTSAGAKILSFNAQHLRMTRRRARRPTGATRTGSPRVFRRG